MRNNLLKYSQVQLLNRRQKNTNQGAWENPLEKKQQTGYLEETIKTYGLGESR